MNTKQRILIALTASLIAGKSFGVDLQTPPQVGQVEQVQTRQQLTGGMQFQTTVPALYPGEEQDVGRQMIVEQMKRQQWFQLALDSEYFYTSNMFLTKSEPVDTGLLVSTVEFAVTPVPLNTPSGDTGVRFGYRHQRFNYGLDRTENQLNNFDFDVSTVYAEAHYRFFDKWIATLNLDYNRLLSDEDDLRQFYTEWVPSLSLNRQFDIAGNMSLNIGFTGNYRFTQVNSIFGSRNAHDRTDLALSATYTWAVTSRIVLKGFYRLQGTYYPDYLAGDSRGDILNTVGLSATYYFNSWSSIRTFINYDVRSSPGESIYNYSKLDVGGGVSVTFTY